MRRALSLALLLALAALPAAGQVIVNGQGGVVVNGVLQGGSSGGTDSLAIDNSGSGLDATLRQVVDGASTGSPLWMSTAAAELFDGVLSWDWTDATAGKTVWKVKTNDTTRGDFNLVFVDAEAVYHDPVWHLGYNVAPGFIREHTGHSQGNLVMTFEGDYTGLGEWHIQGLDTSNVNHRMHTCSLTYATGVTSCAVSADQYVIYDDGNSQPLLSFTASWGGVPAYAQIVWDHGSFYVGTYGSAMLFKKSSSGYKSGFGFDPYNSWGTDYFALGDPYLNSTTAASWNAAYIAGTWRVHGSSQTNGLTLTTIAAPSAPIITNGGTPGSTAYSYAVVCKAADGTVTQASAAGSTATGAATLNSTDYNTITWTGTGARCDVYRTASAGTPATTGKILSDKQSPQNDTGLSASGSAPTANATGYLAVTLGTSVASAATIAPTGPLFHVTAANEITTITLPYTGFVGSIQLIPDAAFTTNTGGNIALASTAVVGKVLTMTFDGTSWYPSY